MLVRIHAEEKPFSKETLLRVDRGQRHSRAVAFGDWPTYRKSAEVCSQCGEPYEAGRCLPEKCGMA